MSTKNLSRRQILASGAALAAPMLALSTPAYVHAALDSCKKNNPQGPSFNELISQIKWNGVKKNPLGSDNTITFGTKSGVPGVYVKHAYPRTNTTVVDYYYGKNTSSSSGQSYTLFAINKLTCENIAVQRLEKRRCLPAEITGDELYEDVGRDGVPDAPWILNSYLPSNGYGDPIRLQFAFTSARTHTSSINFRDVFGWFDYRLTTDDPAVDDVYRRVWMWDPLNHSYRVIERYLGSYRSPSGDTRNNDGEVISTDSTEQFRTPDGLYLTSAINGIIRRLSSINWDSVTGVDRDEMVAIAAMNYGEDLGFTNQYELAAISQFSMVDLESFLYSIEQYRTAITAVRAASDNFIWRPRSNNPENPIRPTTPTTVASTTGSVSSSSHCTPRANNTGRRKLKP